MAQSSSSALPPAATGVRRLAAISFALALSATPAVAQGDNGFVRGQGQADVAVTYTLDYYDEFWVGTDRMSAPPVGEIERTSYGLYAAYGITNDVDLVLNGAFVEAESDGVGGFPDESDLQDAAAGVKWRVLRQRAGKGEFVFLAAPSVKFPMSDYEDDNVTAIGDGQSDLRGRVIAQYQCDNGAYFAVETGYDWRNDAPEDEIPLNVSGGYTFANQITLSPFYSRVWSRGGVDIGQGPFPSVREEAIRVGLAAYWRLNDAVGISGMYRETLDGRNTGDADAYSLGLVFTL